MQVAKAFFRKLLDESASGRRVWVPRCGIPDAVRARFVSGHAFRHAKQC